MFNVTHLVGVDPGLVHTGVVLLTFDRSQRTVVTDHVAVAGPDAVRVQQFLGAIHQEPHHIFIEGYRPRSNFNTDQRMVEAVGRMRDGLPKATVLDNTGVKKVIRRPLMELLGCWSFSTPTHHQDLRSAARIALLGAVKDDELNRLIADVVKAHIDNNPWRIVTS